MPMAKMEDINCAVEFEPLQLNEMFAISPGACRLEAEKYFMTD